MIFVLVQMDLYLKFGYLPYSGTFALMIYKYFTLYHKAHAKGYLGLLAF